MTRLCACGQRHSTDHCPADCKVCAMKETTHFCDSDCPPVRCDRCLDCGEVERPGTQGTWARDPQAVDLVPCACQAGWNVSLGMSS